MNNAIIDSINSKVMADDTLYHLGDWSFGAESEIVKFSDSIKCRNIILIFGNHDKKIRKGYTHLFTKCYDLLKTNINGKTFVLCHYAMRVWENSHHGSYHLYGHSHHSIPDIGKSMDVGWCKYRSPLSFEEVDSILSSREIVGHHS